MSQKLWSDGRCATLLQSPSKERTFVESEGRRVNRAAVLAEVLSVPATTRADIGRHTGLSGATVSRIIDALHTEGLVRETPSTPNGKRGRTASQVEVVADRIVACGVDLGASNTRIVLTDLLARPLSHHTVPTPDSLRAKPLAEWLATTIQKTAGDRYGAVGAVAVGLPGAVAQADRAVSNAPNLPQVEDPDFLTVIGRSLAVALEVDNDSNYALLGEQRFGAARDAPTAVMVTIGAGLGAGVAIDNRILRGRRGLVGEFGRLPMGPLGTPLEHMVTGPGILRRAAEHGLDLLSPADLFSADAAPRVQAMRAQVEQALVLVLTAAVVSYEPDVIVLGGGIAHSLGSSVGRLATAVHGILRSAPPVVLAELGDLSGALGAAVAALHRIYAGFGVAPTDLRRIPHPRVFEASRLVEADDFEPEFVPLQR